MNKLTKYPKTSNIYTNFKHNKGIYLSLKKEDMYIPDSNDYVIINLSNYCINSEFDKDKLIRNLRLIINFHQHKSEIMLGFTGLADMCIKLNIRYGSIECIKFIQEFKRLLSIHISSYTNYIKKPNLKVKINCNLKSNLYLENFAENIKPYNKLYIIEDNKIILNELFLKTLENYGYDKNQIINLINISIRKNSLKQVIPNYIYKLFILQIDNYNQIKEILEK